jgi:transposase-like protein
MKNTKNKLDLFYGIDKHMERFNTEEDCLNWIKASKWENGIPTCPDCQNRTMNYYITKRKTYKCSKCANFFSPLSGTIFEKTRTPLKKWFMIIYHFTQFYQIPSTQLAREVGLPQPTVYKILQKLRIALKEMNDDVLLSGEVEMDAAYNSIKIDKNSRVRKNWNNFKKKYEEMKKGPDGILGSIGKSGRRTEDTEVVRRAALKQFNKTEVYGKSHAIIFGMQERKGRLILRKIGASSECISARRVLSTAIQHISRDANIYVDDHACYNAIKLLFDKPFTINHSEKKYVDGDIHTNSIESVFNTLKPMLKRHRRISFKHLDKYLLQFTFRWNNRHALPIDCTNAFLPFLIQKKQKMQEVGDRFIEWVEAA